MVTASRPCATATAAKSRPPAISPMIAKRGAETAEARAIPRSTSNCAETRSPWGASRPLNRASRGEPRAHQQHADDQRHDVCGGVQAERERRCDHDRGKCDLEGRVDGEGYESCERHVDNHCDRRTRVPM